MTRGPIFPVKHARAYTPIIGDCVTSRHPAHLRGVGLGACNPSMSPKRMDPARSAYCAVNRQRTIWSIIDKSLISCAFPWLPFPPCVHWDNVRTTIVLETTLMIGGRRREARAKISNRAGKVADFDGRRRNARRVRDLVAAFALALGGPADAARSSAPPSW